MLRVIEDNFCTPRVIRIATTEATTEVFVRQTREGLVLRPQSVRKISKNQALVLAEHYFSKYPKEKGPLPFFLEGELT